MHRCAADTEGRAQSRDPPLAAYSDDHDPPRVPSPNGMTHVFRDSSPGARRARMHRAVECRKRGNLAQRGQSIGVIDDATWCEPHASRSLGPQMDALESRRQLGHLAITKDDGIMAREAADSGATSMWELDHVERARPNLVETVPNGARVTRRSRPGLPRFPRGSAMHHRPQDLADTARALLAKAGSLGSRIWSNRPNVRNLPFGVLAIASARSNASSWYYFGVTPYVSSSTYE